MNPVRLVEEAAAAVKAPPAVRQQLRHLVRQAARRPIPWNRLFPPEVASLGDSGLSCLWRRLPKVVVVSIDSEGLAIRQVDTGAREGGVTENDPNAVGLVSALRWLARDDDMLIRPARSPEPLEPALCATPRVPLPLVSVVVACYGALELTKGLVASLRANAGCEYELLLVDDACPEQTWRWADQRGLPCIRHLENQGLPRTLNEGAAAVRGEILALWNSDMLVRPDGLRRLAEAAQAHGIAGQSGGCFRSGGHYAGQTGDRWQADYPEGYCLTVRRDVWENVGGWDPVYWPTNCDDSDWALRARLRGHDFVLVPGCVNHFGQASTNGVDGFNQVVHRNQEILRERYARHGLGERLLVRRWGATGDLLMMTPALRALKRKWPLSRLHVQCHDVAGVVLSDLPYVDGVFTAPPPRVQYTHRLNLDGAYEAGQAHGRWEHPAPAFCRAAGVEYDGEPYDLRLRPGFVEWAQGVLPVGPRYVAAVVRSACRPKANWKAAEWIRLADSLPEDIRLVALDAERQPALGVRGPTGEEAGFYGHPRVLDLTGQTRSFLHAAALIGRCGACVSVDTGLLHAASALGVPTVALYGGVPGAAREPVRLTHTYAGRADCLPCQNPGVCMRTDGRHCLDRVTGSDVAAQVRRILEEAKC